MVFLLDFFYKKRNACMAFITKWQEIIILERNGLHAIIAGLYVGVETWNNILVRKRILSSSLQAFRHLFLCTVFSNKIFGETNKKHTQPFQVQI